MPSLPGLTLALAVVAVLSACQAEPEAKYPEDLSSCELLPREAARKVTDVGPKLGPAEQKTWNFLVTYKYCQWTYKQPREHFWSSYRKGPVERRLTVRTQVTSAKSGGAPAVAVQYDGQLDSERKAGRAVQEVSGIGAQAMVATQTHGDGSQSTAVTFRRSNALVTVSLYGEDCCVGQGRETDMRAANRRKNVLDAATAVDHALLSR